VKVVFSRNAEHELEEIGDWIARDNPERARSFVNDLIGVCKAISRTPHAYPFVNRRRDPTLRRRVYRSYLIFFDIGSREVEILHVLHGARDYAQIVFANDEDE
jgi:plasmid stabilization system protein ParE